MLASQGRSLDQGRQKWQDDMGALALDFCLKLTRPTAFKVGQNVASTPGKVVLRTPLLELIHYAPVKETVWGVPLLIVPPWINKFYIFDLQHHHSFVQWALAQGLNVFMISWANPEQGRGGDADFLAYLRNGVLAALQGVLSLTQSASAHLLGLCVGGNLALAASGYLKATGRQEVKTLTLLASILNPAYLGPLKEILFPSGVQFLKTLADQKKVLDGRLMALMFSLLRAQEMVWDPLIRRYFLGKDPFPLDFLFWNADPQNISPTLQLDFVELFLNQGAGFRGHPVTLGEATCDLMPGDVPRFTLGSLKDHIAPWKSCFPPGLGPCDLFCLASAGHVAGVLSPPGSKKRGYWTTAVPPSSEGGGAKSWNPEGSDPEAWNPEAWLKKATSVSGSWWPLWSQWIQKFSGPTVPATLPGSHPDFPSLQDAPGTYVKG
jgi:polyhydroxyalkanoate synthase